MSPSIKLDDISENKVFIFKDFRKKLEEVFESTPQKRAVVSLNKDLDRATLTYSDIAHISEEINDLLKNSGLKRLDRIAIASLHTSYTTVLTLSLAYLGYTAVLLDVSLPSNELEKLIQHSDVSALFTVESLYKQFNRSILDGIPVFEIKNDFTYDFFNDSLKCVSKVIIEPTSENVVAIIFSSGITGNMKGVKITYNSIYYAYKYILQYTNLSSSATFLDVLPYSHIAGYSAAISCFLTGAELGFLPEVNASYLAQGLLQYEPTNFIMIPKVYEIIMKKIKDEIAKKPLAVRFYAEKSMALCGFVRRLTGIKLRFLTKPIYKRALGRNMKICGCGTAPCSDEVIRFYLDLGIDFVNVYGATETGFPITATNCNDKYPTEGAGRINQFSNISIIIANPDSSGTGEIRVKTPLIMDGYYRDVDLTSTAFENQYFKTGDYGFIDKNGFLHVTGRIKEAIILKNGNKVSPINVDEYYSSKFPQYDIATKGFPVENGQYDEIHLFISTQNIDSSKLNDIVSAYQSESRLAPSMYKISKIHSIQTIPRTSTGKVKRFCLTIPTEEKDVIYNSISKTKKEMVFDCIREIAGLDSNFQIGNDMSLRNDIGIDSLGILELCTAIDGIFNTSIETKLEKDITVGELITKIFGKQDDEQVSESIINESLLLTDEDEYKQKNKQSNRFFNLLKMFTPLVSMIFNPIIINKENIVKDINVGVIYAPNHQRTLDPIIITAILNEHIHWAALQRFFDGQDSIFNNSKNPILCKLTAILFKKLGYIPIQRKSDSVDANNYAAISSMIAYLKIGAKIGIFPEGTIRKKEGNDFGVFDELFISLAKQTHSIIQPITILWTKNKESKHKVAVNFGKAFSIKDMSVSDAMKMFLQIQSDNLDENRKYL